jgi:hypothetical protein
MKLWVIKCQFCDNKTGFRQNKKAAVSIAGKTGWGVYEGRVICPGCTSKLKEGKEVTPR